MKGKEYFFLKNQNLFIKSKIDWVIMVAPIPVWIASVVGYIIVLRQQPSLRSGVGTGIGLAFYNTYLWDSLPGPPPEPITISWWITAIGSAFLSIMVIGLIVNSFVS